MRPGSCHGLIMSNRYERNATARRLDNERRLMGESLAQFHLREAPLPTPPGAGIPRRRCKATEDLFDTPQPQLFDRIEK